MSELPDAIEHAIRDHQDGWRHANGGENYLELAQADTDNLRATIAAHLAERKMSEHTTGGEIVKPTAHRARKVIEEYEKEYMNKVLPMLDAAPPEIKQLATWAQLRAGVFNFRDELMWFYKKLAYPEQ